MARSVVGIDRDDFVLVVLLFVAVFADLVILDDIDAHFAERRRDVFDLVRIHLARGQRLVQLVIGDVTALFCPRDQLFQLRVVQIDEGRIARFLNVFRGLGHVCFRH